MNKGDKANQDYHTAIKNVVEHLKSKRLELQNDINCDEREKARLMGEMNLLQDKLSILNANLRKKSEFRKEYDKAISQSEEHFVELLQKSEDFLSLTRREALALSTAVSDTPKCIESQCPSNQNVLKAMKVQKGPREGGKAGEPCGPPAPAAVVVIPAPSVDNCGSCTNASTCATIMVPYRANGL